MKNTLMLLLVTGMVAVAFTPANAVTWNFYDFGNNIFDEHNNTADIDFPGYPGQPDPFQPNPGQAGLGGERFDTEGLNFALANNKFYVSLTASFKYGAYSSVWNYTYREGDLFFGFDGSDREYAIVTRGGVSKLYDVDSYLTIPTIPGGFGYNPAIVASMGPWRINQGTELGSVQNAYTFYDELEPNPIIPSNPSQTNGDTWIKEYCFDLSTFGASFNINQFKTVNFRTTIECGNDLVKESHAIAPEPGTMILLGMGLLGVGAHLRRRK
jgi:hypothetical protein